MTEIDAGWLVPLTGRVAGLAAECRVHGEAYEIGEAALTWAGDVGLAGDTGLELLCHARFERMAGRCFPDADVADAALFAKWLLWLFVFDDARDDAPERVAEQYDSLLGVLRGDRPYGPLGIALADLWQATAPRMSQDWRDRFVRHAVDHRDACVEKARRRLPTVAEYPELCRRANGRWMFDLAEPILHAEVPASLVATPVWQTLVESTGDVIAWCNDVASYTKEVAADDTHNYVTVVRHHLDLTATQAVEHVSDHIADRMTAMADAARALPTEVRAVTEVACCLLAAPRAHLEWLLESGRYRAPARGVVGCDV